MLATFHTPYGPSPPKRQTGCAPFSRASFSWMCPSSRIKTAHLCAFSNFIATYLISVSQVHAVAFIAAGKAAGITIFDPDTIA